MVVCCGGSYVYSVRSTEDRVDGTVTDTYVRRNDDGDVFHAVIQYEDGEDEIFQNANSIPFLKFSSDDLQSELEKAEEAGLFCTFRISEGAVPFASGVRNIIEIDECSPPVEE